MNVVLLQDDIFPAQGSVDSDTRPPGLHISDIYSDIDLTLNGPPEHWDNAAEPGFLWEDVFSKAWMDKAVQRGLVFRPDPFQVEGIWVSPDGVNLEEGTMRLEEYKFAWQSSNKPPQDRWKWMTQMKAYCYALGFTETNLRVFYCNGDYRQDRRPKYKGFRFTFQEDELLENWVMLTNHAKSKGWL